VVGLVQVSILASSVLMGAVLLGLGVALATYGPRRRAVPAIAGSTPSPGAVRRVASSPTAWMAGFLLLVAATAGGALLFLTNPGVVAIPGGAVTLLFGSFALAVACYFVWGVYHNSRYRGLHPPAAAAAAVSMAGMLLIGLIVLALLELI
jgi:hypothetical protein